MNQDSKPEEAQKENTQKSLSRQSKKRQSTLKFEAKKIMKKQSNENSDDSEPPQPKIEYNNPITKYFKTTKADLQQQQPVPLNELSLRINEKDQIEKQLTNDIEKLKKNISISNEKFNNFKKKCQGMFAQYLKENEELKRRNLKEQIEKEKKRLGEYVSRRDGVRFLEEWQDGQEIRQVKERLKQMELQQEQLEKEKNDPKSAKGDKSRICFQLSTIQKEEYILRQKLLKLEEEKVSLIQQMKRFNDEKHCRYALEDNSQGSWPCLQNKYQLLGLLGKGGFSEVYKGFDLEEFRLVGIKLHQLIPNWSEQSKSNYIKHALRESQIQQQLKHENIVGLYDVIEIDNDSFCTVLEYCDGSDLSQYLKKYKCLSEKEAMIIIRQILAALFYLSQQNKKIIHYDLKPSNIMFNKGEVKIADFGLSKMIEMEQTRMELTSQGLGTYWYLPPECFIISEDNPVTISTKVDVWSVGVIMYEMIYNQRPFGQGMSQERVAQEQVMLKATSVNFPSKPILSSDGKDFIRKCLTYNMEARWDIADAYQCAYLNKK